jgi:hypothetical protein
MKEEKWMEVKGYEKLYEVSNYGNVRSFVRKKGELLIPNVNNRGYYKIYLYKKGCKRKETPIHRLVAKHFLPNYFKGAHINHKDGNKLNNYIDNLEWCTLSDNIKHAITTLSRHAFRNGEVNLKSKLTNEQVLEIRQKYSTGNTSYKKLSAEYGVYKSTIGRIVKKKNWNHI